MQHNSHFSFFFENDLIAKAATAAIVITIVLNVRYGIYVGAPSTHSQLLGTQTRNCAF